MKLLILLLCYIHFILDFHAIESQTHIMHKEKNLLIHHDHEYLNSIYHINFDDIIGGHTVHSQHTSSV